ncbi:MAG: hypothetical protein AAF311_10585 [Pseudomonadota bacterium]
MMRTISIAALLLAFGAGVPGIAHGQDQTVQDQTVQDQAPQTRTAPSTDRTDQSEEDWRNSRKKRSVGGIPRRPGPRIGAGGGGVDYRPVTAVERLPEDSRRHLMRERAKAIAQSDTGDLSDAAYEPSEAAQSDEALRRDEQQAWAELITPPGGSGGGGNAAPNPSSGQPGGQDEDSEGGSPGGPLPVGLPSPDRQPRGGSARSLQDIMDSIKSGQTEGATAEQVAGMGDSQGEGTSGGEGASSQDGSDAATDAEPLSPLERIRRERDDRPAQGGRRSAADYLGRSTPVSAPDR